MTEVYKCRGCNMPPRATKWKGPCPNCRGLWAIVHVTDRSPGTATLASLGDTKAKPRISSGIQAIDDVLGGGFVKGSTIILSGPPGVGKSTILLTVSDKVAKGERKVTYASGEQSVADLSDIVRRLDVSNERVLVMGMEGDIYKITNEVEKSNSALLVIDSLQTAFLDDCDAEEGSPTQCKSIVNYLTAWAKRENVCVLLIGHIAKDGSIAGPRTLEHLVDGLLELDPADTEETDAVDLDEGEKLIALTSSDKYRLGPSGVSRFFKLTSEGVKPVRKRSKLVP